jgi:uncharacterized protein (DUF305 family)
VFVALNSMLRRQRRRLARMKQWREAWYGSAKVPTDMSDHGSTDDMDMGR